MAYLKISIGCYWYHKGKTFQANHNIRINTPISLTVVIDTTKVRLFKQITTTLKQAVADKRCYWYHKGKTFQANHNGVELPGFDSYVVIDTTKVRLFKQITTGKPAGTKNVMLLLIPQR